MATDYDLAHPPKFEDIIAIDGLHEEVCEGTLEDAKCVMDEDRNCLWFYINDGLVTTASRYGGNDETNIIQLVRDKLGVGFADMN